MIAEQWGLRPARSGPVLPGSHEKAAAAQDAGAFDDQIVGIKTDADGNPVTKDEGIRRGTTVGEDGKPSPPSRRTA